MSRSLLTSRTMSCCPIACAAACTSLRSASVSGVFGFTSMAIVVALGTSWRNSSSRFAPNTPAKKTTPVTLPPGRLRLATRPSLTGSLPVAKTIGTVVVAALAASAARAISDDHGHRPANQISHQSRQPINLIVRIAIFDRDVLALDEACFLQALAERGHEVRRSRRATCCGETRSPASPAAARAPRAATPPPRRRAA